MNVKSNLHAIEKALEEFNVHNLEAFIEFYSESATHFQPNRAEPLEGKKEIFDDYFKSTLVAFPDIQFVKSVIFGQNNWACIEGVLKGTHKGPLEGPNGEVISPTNYIVSVPICFVIQMENGKAIEVHEYNDQLGFLKQLNLL